MPALGLHHDRENFLVSPRSATHTSTMHSLAASGPEDRSELFGRSDGAASAFATDMSIPPTPPRRPQSAGVQGRSGGIRRPGARHPTVASIAGRQPATPRQGNSIDGLSTRSVDRSQSASGSVRARKDVSSSQRPCLCDSSKSAADEPVGGIKDGAEVVSALMLAVLHIFEHRTNQDLWTKLLQPLKSLVPCEDIKVVVRSVGPPPQEPLPPGPFDPHVRRRMKPVSYVEQWSHQRIDGEAALTQRICRYPSAEAERHHWDQYEVARSQANTLRCLVAVPLFDADGNVLAVVKLINRRSPDGAPRLEFSQADLTTLSAFSAIFACIIPHPFLGLPGAGLCRRPQARITLADSGISAIVSWQVPSELRGCLIHEIRFGEVDHEDEYAGRPPQDQWSVLPCGLLDSRIDGHEASYDFPVPVLRADTSYAFCVRLRNTHVLLDWSEPSVKLPTFLAPPHSIGQEAVQLFPLSESMVQLEWTPFDTCDPGLTLIEYRVVARTVLQSRLALSDPRPAVQDSDSHRTCDTADEQVVAVFISDGTPAREVATIANLQSNMTYNFAIEARYAYVGTRTFTRVLVSDQFCFPTVDITLPAPQPLAADMVMFKGRDMSTPTDGPTLVLLKWPYPLDLASQLVLQYRTASIATETRASDKTVFPRFHVSTWNNVRASDCLHAQLVRDDAASELRVLSEGAVEGHLAVQLRVVMMPHAYTASPPSAWFHPQPPAQPEEVHTGLVCSDSESIAMQITWQCPPHTDGFFDNEGPGESSSRELGPVGYAVHHDFSRGNGPSPLRFQVRLRPVSASGEPRADWEELSPQPLPPKSKQFPSQMSSQMRPFLTTVPALDDKGAVHCYQWLLHEQRWFIQPGASYEVQIRHGNVLFWSNWSSGGIVLIQVQPPCAGSQNSLLLQDVRADSARLTWTPFLPCEAQLRALEYRILCLELPDGNDKRPDAGGRLISWRALDTVAADVEPLQLPGGDVAPLQYMARSLLPSRRYMFAVECRYLGLPSALAAASLARLEAQEPLPSRGIELVVLPNSFAAAVQLAHLNGSTSQRAMHGFILRFQWRFRIQPLSASVPAALSYQISCVPEDCGDVARERVLLPPALMSERGRNDGIATFFIDRAREFVSADAELQAEAVQSLFPARSRLQFAVRLGDPSTGYWGTWSETMSDVIELTIASPVPAEDQALAVNEQLWSQYGTDIVPQQALHAAEMVTLVWAPFQPAPTTALERHTQLEMEYSVTVWAVDPSAPALEGVRASLCRSAVAPADARLVYKTDIRQSQMDRLSEYQNCCRVPGDCLYPTKYHYFKVIGRYVFPDGSFVPEPEVGRPPTAVLISSDPYRPTMRRLPAPRIERFTPPHDESCSPCVVLLMPVQEPRSFDTEPTVIESREGCVYTGRPDAEATVVASGDWTPHLPDNIEALPGDRPRVLLRGLKPMQAYQFRLRRGSAESEASSWTDSAVWRPNPLTGPQLMLQMRRGGGAGRCSIQGLGVGLGIGRDSTLYARLAWPRHPPYPTAVKLARYQVRYRSCGKNFEWHVLPTVDLPTADVNTAECQVSELLHGGRYEFAIRLCNALGRWSDWCDNTVPLHLSLPAPAPGESTDLRATISSPSVVKLNWRPFSVPRRDETAVEPPLLLDGADETQGTVTAEYEVLICETDSSGCINCTVSIMQREASVLFDELLYDTELPWFHEEVTLEPQKSYCFQVRARFRTGPWGPVLTSSALLPRLLPISMGSPLVDMLMPASTMNAGMLEAVLHVECAVRGFHRGDLPSAHREQPGADRMPAKIAQYQIRSCLQNGGSKPEAWAEWPCTDAGPVHNAVDRVLQIDVPVHAAAVPLLTGGTYIFGLRCADEHGRWTSWSTETEPVSIQAPSLVPSLNEKKAGGSNLRVTAMGDHAALLEWTQFRPDWDTAGVQKGMDACLQRVTYRLRMTKRLANSMDDWISTPLTELISERRLAGALTHDVTDLDARFEYVFYLSARWLNVPLVLGSQGWTPEISSPVLPSRLKELRAPEPPFAEVLASDTQGLCLQARWCPSVALRDATGLPVAGARYQVRFVQVPRRAAPQPEALPSWNWQIQHPILETSAESLAHEAISRVSGPIAGGTYVLSVRVGDAYRWSPWSRPSEPVLFAVQPPIPSPGDVLEIACEPGASDSMKLEWRPFRTAADLGCVEYKVMALEWPHEEMPKDNGVLARLKRNAEILQNGHVLQAGSKKFRPVGYVTRQCMVSNQLRASGDHVEWRTEGLRPGMCYRFFVCARYVSLPMGAMLPLQSSSASAAESETQTFVWPDEHYDKLRADTVAWEASLSRLGLWSPIVNTAHLPHYSVQPLMPSPQPPATLRCLPPPDSVSEAAADGKGCSSTREQWSGWYPF